jgi:hypothetical protein
MPSGSQGTAREEREKDRMTVEEEEEERERKQREKRKGGNTEFWHGPLVAWAELPLGTYTLRAWAPQHSERIMKSHVGHVIPMWV